MTKIVVIGAGLSGLTAAFRLHEKGFDVEVYEARGRVGGRVLTIHVNGHLAELGGENISNGGEAPFINTLLRDLNLEAEITKSVFDIVYCKNGEQTSFTQLLRKYSFSSQLKARLQKIAEGAKNMDEVLLSLFPERGLVYQICRVALAGYEGAPAESLSVFYIETLYHMLLGGFSSAHPHNNGDGPAYLDRMFVKGGNSLLPLKLAERLQDRVHLNHALVKIAKNAAGSYVLSFQNGHTVIAESVVLSIPCSVIKDVSISSEVIPAQRKRDIELIQYGTPSKIVLPVSEVYFEKQYASDAFFTFFNRSIHVANLYYVGGQGQFTEEGMRERFQQDLLLLQKIYPIQEDLQPVLSIDEPFFSYSDPVGHSWPNDPYAQGAYSCIGAGQEELFTSLTEVKGDKVKNLFAPINESFFFAGEHTSALLDLGGTMEAAVESGEKAARLVERSIPRNVYL
jgi:monoamine oxidase